MLVKELRILPLPDKGFNQGYDPTQIIECFQTGIWIGAGRFNHSSYLRYDDVLSNKKAGWVHCNSGFYSHGFLNKLETKRLNYVVAVKFYPTIKENLEV